MSRINRKKHEIDATNQAPGRLATKIATLLIGKHKTHFEPHLDNGDRVTVLNAQNIKFTGKKLDQKEYKHHSMHPGGLKIIPAKKMLAEKPENVIRLAVMKMLPKNKLRDQRMQRLLFK
jgi:large subunit ribosomal protein L13